MAGIERLFFHLSTGFEPVTCDFATLIEETELHDLSGFGDEGEDLRPGGIARIGGERVDVVTQGDFVGAGEAVEVIRDEGYRRVVRRLDTDEGSPNDL